MRDDVAHQLRRGLRHPPGSARRGKAAPLATESDQLVEAAVAAAQACLPASGDGNEVKDSPLAAAGSMPALWA
jgi:hypothetical protein